MSRKNNSRALGATFERTVATQLRGWLGDEYEVKRNPTDRQGGSGGLSGEFSVTGGPFAFPFCVECKRHSTFNVEQLWRGTGPMFSTGKRQGFWAQAAEQAKAVDLLPLLILRKPPQGAVFAVMRSRSLYRMQAATQANGIPEHQFSDGGGPLDGDDLSCVLWSDVLAMPSSALVEVSDGV